MSGYRKALTTFLSVIIALVMLERCGSKEATGQKNQGRLDEENVCSDNGSERCDNGDGDSEKDRCVSFSNAIQPIFDNRCINCHNPTQPRGALDLTAGNSYGNLVNAPTSPGCMAEPESVRVVPCDPAASMLWRKTRPDDSRCRSPMPLLTPGLGVIAPDEFALIEMWIFQGALNN